MQDVLICVLLIYFLPNIEFSKLGLWDEAEEYGALDCIECGCCSYICPAKILGSKDKDGEK